MTEVTLATYDYAAFTGQATADDGAPPALRLLPSDQRLSSQALADIMRGEERRRVMLDVRPAAQFAIGHLAGEEHRCLIPDPTICTLGQCAAWAPLVTAACST